MIYLMILGVFIIGMAGFAGYTLLSITDVTRKTVKTADEHLILDQWENLITQNTIRHGPNQYLSPPLGEDYVVDEGLPTEDIVAQKLPSYLNANVKNAWGHPLVYCPYGEVTTLSANGTVQLNATETYDIETIAQSGRDYVWKSDVPVDVSAQSKGVIAFIMSPMPNTSTIPDCSNVIYNGERFKDSTGAAVVRAITKENSTGLTSGGVEVVDFHSEYGLTDPLNNALNSWDSAQYDRVYVKLTDRVEPYLVTDLELAIPQSSTMKEIVFVGETRAGTVIDVPAAGAQETLSFENLKVTFRDLSFDDDLTVSAKNSEVILDNVTLNELSIEKSRLVFEGTATFNGTAHSVNTVNAVDSEIDFKGFNVNMNGDAANTAVFSLDGSKINSAESVTLTMATDATIPLILAIDGSQIYADSLTVLSSGGAIKPLSLLSLDSSSSAVLRDSFLTANADGETILYTQGNVELNNTDLVSNVPMPYAVILDDQARFSANNGSLIGSASPSDRPVTTIDDRGATFIFGTGAVINGNQCWQGTIFTSVASPNTGTSEALDNNYKIFNQSNWSCN
ncbi:hypothetical protein [Neptuniibacter sp. QD37_11]|uniref:hypothetical protein n=1 Tax=Neptuniibacter sp. QD37_11 TaxID=3398209 RepID=UPI0039F59F0F